ncbi:MAG: TlpA family protein disulfide reductase [Anaerolineae bacterium]
MASRRSRKHRHSGNNIIPLILVGVGLIVLGATAMIFLPRAGTASLPESSSDLSAIPVEVNFPAPVLELSDVQGKPASLQDYQGQVVLVNLWATWCPPCKAEMPTLEAFYQDYRDKGFTIIAINDGDPAEDVTQFVKKYGLTFSVWLDPTYKASEQAFKTRNLPSSYVIDRNGTVRLMWVGQITRNKLDQYVVPLIME